MLPHTPPDAPRIRLIAQEHIETTYDFNLDAAEFGWITEDSDGLSPASLPRIQNRQTSLLIEVIGISTTSWEEAAKAPELGWLVQAAAEFLELSVGDAGAQTALRNFS